MNGSSSVSMKWLVGALTTITFTGAAGWATHVHSQLQTITTDREKARERESDRHKDTAVIKEKVERLERDMKDMRDDQREQTRKIDELLRRVR